MNSFAALMGSLTGAGISGTVGKGASGTSEGGLFAGLLEAGVANPMNGDTAGAGIKAALAGKDGASAPGTIDLATLLQATTDADGNMVPTGIPVPGAPAIPIVGAVEGEAPSTGTAEEEDATEGGDLVAGDDAAIVGQQPTETPDTTGAGPAQQPSPEDMAAGTDQPATAAMQQNPVAPAETQAKAASGEAVPGQEQAGANRPAQAQLNATTAPGVTGAAQKGNAAPAAAQAAAAPPQSSLESAETADPQQAAKAAHDAANVKAAEEAASTSKRPVVLPAEGENRSRTDLTRSAEVARTITLAPNGQTVMQIIKAGKTDTGPTAGIDQSSTASIHVRPAAAPLQPGAQQPQLPLNGIAVHIAQQAANGARRFDIRLDPPELGRVEVRLDVSKDGKVSTHLVVERSETLDLLQRDARALERALQNAGLDTGDGGMKFSLKDQDSGQAHSGGERQSHGSSAAGDNQNASPSTAEIDNATRTERRYLATGGLDIRI